MFPKFPTKRGRGGGGRLGHIFPSPKYAPGEILDESGVLLETYCNKLFLVGSLTAASLFSISFDLRLNFTPG